MKLRDASAQPHTDYFVEIEGRTNPDGTPCRISMDADTFAKHKFMIGQKITMGQARKFALLAVGGSPARLARLVSMARELGPGRKIEMQDDEPA